MDQQPLPFVNVHTKPKVSSPAPSKIYGRPGSLSTDPIKTDLGLKGVNQIDRSVTEPPPAHSHETLPNLPRVCQTVSPFKTHDTVKSMFKPWFHMNEVLSNPEKAGISQHHHTVIAMGDNSSPYELPVAKSHSPGLHIPSPVTLPNAASISMQSKPLDLGVSDRHRNNTAAGETNFSRTYQTSSPHKIHDSEEKISKPQYHINVGLPNPEKTCLNPVMIVDGRQRPTPPFTQASIQSSPSQQIALDITKTTIINKSNESEPSELINIPAITMTPDKGASTAANANNAIKSYEIDDTSNSSNNSKYDNGRHDIDSVLTNGLTTDSNKNVSVAAISIGAIVSTNNNSDNRQQKSPQPHSSILSIHNNPLRTSSADGFLRSSSTNSSPVPSPNSAQSAPATPNKLPNDYEKSTSQGLCFSLYCQQ